MIAAAIFTLMLLLVIAVYRGKSRIAMLLFFMALVGVALLFKHHATDALNISL